MYVPEGHAMAHKEELLLLLLHWACRDAEVDHLTGKTEMDNIRSRR
jgi:hypothetical protein